MCLLSQGRVFVALLMLMGGNKIAVAQDASPKLEICQSCHGVSGNSEMQGVPSLAGKAASDLATQLTLFRDGQRQNPQMVMARRLTDDEIEELAAFFARQPAK
jgi:cytochrome c553